MNPDGSFTYQPNADITGDDKFTYRALNTSNGKYSNVVEVRIKIEK